MALGDEAVKEIERMEQGYYDPEYLYGQTAASDLTREARIEGCGTLAFHFTLRGTLIEKVSLSGDFFEMDNAAECFNRAFAGAAFTPQSLKQAVEEHHPERSIRGLTAEQLTACLTD